MDRDYLGWSPYTQVMLTATLTSLHALVSKWKSLAGSLEPSETSIGPDILSRDPPCMVRNQQQHRIANILNSSIPIFKPCGIFHWIKKNLFRHRTGNVSANWTRTNSIYRDASTSTPLVSLAEVATVCRRRPYLGSPGISQAINGCLGGAINRDEMLSALGR